MSPSLIRGSFALLASCGAMAQSSVSIYGVLDESVRYVENEGVGHVKSLASGSNLASRLGFQGREDLGGGLSASFVLESGINADTGAFAGGSAFDRQSHVSLIDQTMGTIRLGRDYTPVYSNWGGRFDPFGHVGIGSPGNLLGAANNGPIKAAFGTGSNTLTRASNAVQYIAPAWVEKFEFALMAAAGEGAGASAGQHAYRGGRLGYGVGAVSVSGAVSSTRNSITSGAQFKDASYGVLYSIDGLRLTAAVRRMRFREAKQSTVIVGMTMRAGPGDIKLSVSRAEMSGVVGGSRLDGGNATQIAAGYVYNLSKKTALYATVSRIRNAGASVFTVPGGPASALPGRSSTGAELGIRASL